ncbi:MAG TPA: DUF1838 family protein [Woeseiaceae bacterium]|nr:DUF1838 family protein [Woeseiaceae bacterium]
MTILNRRTILGAAAGLPFLATTTNAAPAAGNTISALTRSETLQAYVKLLGDLESRTVYTWFSGHLWGVVPDKTPIQLVSIEGLAKNVWRAEGDQVFTQRSFDIGFFGDPNTGEAIDEFVNPFSGETVRPYHFMYGGSPRRYSEAGVQTGKVTTPINPHWVESGNQVWMDESFVASVPNPIGPAKWPRESAGDTFHLGSTITYVTNTCELLDKNRTSVPYTLFWSSINSWEPWLLMGSAPGHVMWRGTGRKLLDIAEAPARIRNYARSVEPDYFDKEFPWEGSRSTWLGFIDERNPAPAKREFD